MTEAADGKLWGALWELALEADLRGRVGVNWPSCPRCGDRGKLSFATDRIDGRDVRGAITCGACGFLLGPPAPPPGPSWLRDSLLAADAVRRLGDETIVRRAVEAVPDDTFEAWFQRKLATPDLAELVRRAVLAVDRVFDLAASLDALVLRLDELDRRLRRLEEGSPR